MVFEKARSLGAMYTLDAVYSLDELQLENFPLTSVGKVKKRKLVEIVEEFRGQHKATESSVSVNEELVIAPSSEEPISSPRKEAVVSVNGVEETAADGDPASESSPETEIEKQLVHIWKDIVGIAPDINDSVTTFADSITILRYADRVLNEFGRPIYLHDIPDNLTVRQQAMLLSRRRPALFNQATTIGDSRFSLKSVVFADGSLTRLSQIQTTTAEVLEKINLPIVDIESYIPIKEAFHGMVSGPRPQSWHHRLLVCVENSTIERVGQALELALSTHQMFRAICVKLGDTTPFHVIMKPSKRLFSMLIRAEEVDSIEACNAIESNVSISTFSPITMFCAKVISVKGLSDIRILFSYNHSVFDITSLQAWYMDLAKLIDDPNSKLSPATPFKLFADMEYMYKDSTLAQISANVLAARIQNIDLRSALWPPQKAPGWMIGQDSDSLLASKRSTIREELWAPTSPSQELLEHPIIKYRVECNGLPLLKTHHNLSAKLAMQTAIVLFNVHTTGIPFAVYEVMDAGRSWPFIPSWIASNLPPAASIDGPTTESILCITHIDPSGRETIRELMERIERDNTDISAHAHVSRQKIAVAVSGEAGSGALLDQRQSFTWDSSTEILDWGKIKAVSRFDWPDW
jgi:hypothetical protein